MNSNNSNVETNSDYARPKQAAAYFGLSESFIRTWISQKKIPYYKLGKNTFVRKSEIEKMISQHRV